MRHRLLEARSRAAQLFRAIEDERLVREGQTEAQVSAAICALAAVRFDVRKHWHRRIVRSGPHTRLPYRDVPPDRTITGDDIVSLDLGPVFEDDEADFGRTYVIGTDPTKVRLQGDLSTLFRACRDFYLERPEMTGRALFEHVVATCGERGWGFGGAHAGHLIGAFFLPNEERDAARNQIRPENERPMSEVGDDGSPRHWVLEIHLLDPSGMFGGFYEDLLVAES